MSLWGYLTGIIKTRNIELRQQVYVPEKDKLPDKFYIVMDKGGWWIESISTNEPSFDKLKIGNYILTYELKEKKQLSQLIPTWKEETP